MLQRWMDGQVGWASLQHSERESRCSTATHSTEVFLSHEGDMILRLLRKNLMSQRSERRMPMSTYAYHAQTEAVITVNHKQLRRP